MPLEHQSHRMRFGEGTLRSLLPVNLAIKVWAVMSPAQMACSTKL